MPFTPPRRHCFVFLGHLMLIQLFAEAGEVVEWGLIELQGKIERKEDDNGELPLEVGTLVQSSQNPDVVQLTIGYHLLEGKRVPLKKPLAILDQDEGDGEKKATKYRVVGVIRHKYLFKHRPRALITKPQQRK